MWFMCQPPIHFNTFRPVLLDNLHRVMSWIKSNVNVPQPSKTKWKTQLFCGDVCNFSWNLCFDLIHVPAFLEETEAVTVGVGETKYLFIMIDCVDSVLFVHLLHSIQILIGEFFFLHSNPLVIMLPQYNQQWLNTVEFSRAELHIWNPTFFHIDFKQQIPFGGDRWFTLLICAFICWTHYFSSICMLYTVDYTLRSPMRAMMEWWNRVKNKIEWNVLYLYNTLRLSDRHINRLYRIVRTMLVRCVFPFDSLTTKWMQVGNCFHVRIIARVGRTNGINCFP